MGADVVSELESLASWQVVREAVQAVEQDGIVFIDEIDKIVSSSENRYGAPAAAYVLLLLSIPCQSPPRLWESGSSSSILQYSNLGREANTVTMTMRTWYVARPYVVTQYQYRYQILFTGTQGFASYRESTASTGFASFRESTASTGFRILQRIYSIYRVRVLTWCHATCRSGRQQ